MDELLARHRKELRDLTARITQKKKQATKKTRKGVNSECERLEQDLRERHAREMAELADADGADHRDHYHDHHDHDHEPAEAQDDHDHHHESPAAPAADTSTEEVDGTAASSNATPTPAPTTTTSSPPPPSSASSPSTAQKKPSRQKARLARRAAELAAAASAAEAEAAAQPNLREQELSRMSALLRARGLREQPIPPDGHCLYSAFADQLAARGVVSLAGGSRDARRRCADEMRARRDEYEPFAVGAFEEHVRRVGETAEWGGHLEVLALGRAFGVKVNVLQAEGRVERLNEDADGGEVWLGYYRHSYGLGEHYNSLREKEDGKEAAEGKK